MSLKESSADLFPLILPVFIHPQVMTISWRCRREASIAPTGGPALHSNGSALLKHRYAFAASSPQDEAPFTKTIHGNGPEGTAGRRMLSESTRASANYKTFLLFFFTFFFSHLFFFSASSKTVLLERIIRESENTQSSAFTLELRSQLPRSPRATVLIVRSCY